MHTSRQRSRRRRLGGRTSDLVRVRLTHPEAELRAVRALAVAARHDPLPPRGDVTVLRGCDRSRRGTGQRCARTSRSAAFNSSSPTSAGGLRKKSPSARICGSAKSSMPLSRMHWANSNAASRAALVGGRARLSLAAGATVVSAVDRAVGIAVRLGIVVGAGDQTGREQHHDGRMTSSRPHTTNVRPTTSTAHRGDPSSIPDFPWNARHPVPPDESRCGGPRATRRG